MCLEDVSCVFGTLGYWKKAEARDIYDRYNTD